MRHPVSYTHLDVYKRQGKTSPPKRFTEDLLLSAMESASSEEFPAGVERKGIGTPATRAAIIEKLVQKGFIERRGDKKTRYLCSTAVSYTHLDVYKRQTLSRRVRQSPET